MAKSITLGRYYPGESPIHRLDPRTKLFFLLIFIISLFLFSSWTGFAFSILVLAIVIASSRVPLSYMVRGLRSVVFIILFAAVLNAVLGKGGWTKTLFTTYRMIAIILSSNVLTLTTRPREISDALEKSLSFLSVIGFPVHEMAPIISLAFTFIPILSEEAERIMDAQKSRGARIGEGKLKDKIKSIMPIVIPLFVSAFRRADELSYAMDSRLYGLGERSVWKKMRYRKSDYLVYLGSLLLLGLSVVLRYLPCP